MKRKVEIKGNNKSDLIKISKIFADKDLFIIQDGERFILKSESLNDLCDENEFRGKVNELLNSINAYTFLFLQLEEKFTYQISEIKENGIEIIPIQSCVVGHGKAYANITDGTIVPNKETELFNQIGRNLIKIIENDEKIREIFIYINSNFNSWYELYKVFEILKTNKSAQEIMRSDKYKKKMNDGKNLTGYEIFRRNVNIHRHNKDETKYKPTDPEMTLLEAQYFIKDVIREWFIQKI